VIIESGQAAVVTGAAQGLGRAITAELARRGVSVVMADRQDGALHQAADEIGAEGGIVLPAVVDVADADAVADLAEQAAQRLGRIDLLVNNAGIAPTGGKPLWEADLAQWRRIIDVNLLGVLHGVRAFVPHLVAQGHGHVVNIASLAGLTGTPLSASYGVTKHGVVALSEALRAEFAMLGHPIGVTVVCPGFIRTPMVDGMREMTGAEDWMQRFGDDATQLLEAIKSTMSDMLEPEEAARRILDAVQADLLHALPSGDIADGARARAQTILDALDAQRRQ
jgi:NAD(P)-dependent dehydrogenase (short-subunit alcohol dehydrogenase family)